ncbi:MAG TPA: uroporphyrinogen-III synthase, partial [Actinomycetota bacterium]|nr:uroporphyrinogen-III synthase [Actinomycetota bacterium]
ILITRPLEQSAELVRAIERRGGTPIVAPAIDLVPSRSPELRRALRDLGNGAYEWIALTSPRTVEMLVANVRPRDVRAHVAAIGEGTAEAFHRWARRDADLVPRTYTTLGLARAFPRGDGRVLCARADIAPEGLETALARKGWEADRVEAYRTRLAGSLPKDARDALRRGDVDAVTFTSASTVRGFVRALGAAKGNPRVVCIGPVTAREARDHGFTVSAVARPHTMQGLVAALERVFRPRAR